MSRGAERVLSQRELNRALLARQFLLQRATATLPRVLEQVGGLQAQYAPAMYIGLWSRIAGFARDDLTVALQRRSVVQGTLMRATIHLVSARDYWPFALGIRQSRRDWALRATRDAPSAEELAKAVARLRPSLVDGPVRQADIDRMLGAKTRALIGLWLDFVRVPPAGTWERRRADLYADAEDWLGPAGAAVTASDGVDLLVRRYLAGFGPARRAEIADWAGLPVAEVADSLHRMAATVRRFRAEDGADLVDLARTPLPDAQTPAPVRFLPVWDATLLVHARRTGILPERYRARIFNTKNPHSLNTFLVDGAVAGSWRFERGRIQIEEFEPLARSVRREVDREAEALAAFHA